MEHITYSFERYEKTPFRKNIEAERMYIFISDVIGFSFLGLVAGWVLFMFLAHLQIIKF